MSVSVSRLRNIGAFRARLPFAAPVCSQFVGRSERTCGPKSQQSVDISGIQTHHHLNTCVLEGRRPNQLSQLLLLSSGGQMLGTVAKLYFCRGR